jgi:hypothetical protein
MEPVAFVENIARRDTSNIVIRNRERTHCRSGHPFDGANTYTYTDASGTHRRCRIYHRLRMRAA